MRHEVEYTHSHMNDVFFWFGLLCNEQRRDEKWWWFLNAQCVLNSSNTFLWRLDLKISHTLDTTDTKLDGRVAEKENLLLLFLSLSSVRTASLFHRITWMHCSDDADNFFWHILNISPKVEVDLNCTLNQRLTVGALQLLYCSFFVCHLRACWTFFSFESSWEHLQIGICFFAFTLDLPKIQRETNKNHETYRIVHKNNRNNWSS